jgi:hypothetical protein
MRALERASWQNPKILTTLLLIFVLGAVTGALSMRLGLHQFLHPTSASLKDPHTAKVFLDRCRKELNLTPKQAEEMGSILDDYKLYYESLQDQLEEVRATGKSRIMALLDEQQRRKFERMLTELPK